MEENRAGPVLVNYVWLDGDGGIRSKTRVLYDVTVEGNLPVWNYDGSSCGQATTRNSEVILQPRRVFRCPFRRNNNHNLIVICDTYEPNGKPTESNHRFGAKQIFDMHADLDIWFGMEQEYFICDLQTDLPIGFNEDDVQGRFYCSVGGRNNFGRNLSEEHLEHCLYAGIRIFGTNAAVAPGQWEYQVGPIAGIDVADQLVASRYILERVSEKYHTFIVFHPKPLTGAWNGSGCHTNFSTNIMRKPDSLAAIYQTVAKLEQSHAEHIKVYGKYNDDRLIGTHETSSYDHFTSGVGDRSASVRIPIETVKNGCGYIEDRRPAANMDPYLVTSKILQTIAKN